MLYICRHGETGSNRMKIVMGHRDDPLNENGMAQARTSAKLLADTHIDLIICSPLKRAKQTAEVINERLAVPIIIDDRIIERYYGEFEGRNRDPSFYRGLWDHGLDAHYEKAENIRDFFSRIYGFLDDIKERYPGKDILLVTHGGVSMAVECYFRKKIPEGSLSGTGLALKNCEIRSYEF